MRTVRLPLVGVVTLVLLAGAASIRWRRNRRR